jgi:hypothetical protein
MCARAEGLIVRDEESWAYMAISDDDSEQIEWDARVRQILLLDAVQSWLRFLLTENGAGQQYIALRSACHATRLAVRGVQFDWYKRIEKFYKLHWEAVESYYVDLECATEMLSVLSWIAPKDHPFNILMELPVPDLSTDDYHNLRKAHEQAVQDYPYVSFFIQVSLLTLSPGDGRVQIGDGKLGPRG